VRAAISRIADAWAAWAARRFNVAERKPGQSHLEDLGFEFWMKAVCEAWKSSKERPQADRSVAGAKAHDFCGFCGTTEVVPCYKARFDEVFASA
jgi:hypothetical protein